MHAGWWQSNGLDEAACEVFAAGRLRAVEVDADRVVGIAGAGGGRHLLGTTSPPGPGWAALTAAILRRCNPNRAVTPGLSAAVAAHGANSACLATKCRTAYSPAAPCAPPTGSGVSAQNR